MIWFHHLARMIAILRTLAANDALWPLEPLTRRSIPARMAVRAIRLVWGRKHHRKRASKRPGKRPGKRKGERLADALFELGPSYVKLGQALSVRADLVGEEVAEDLSRLQDRLAPFPSRQAVAMIESELGGKLADHYRHFEYEPVAAASIAQVHFAETHDGRDVAVKILRPHIETKFEADIRLFSALARLAERLAPSLRRLRPVDVVDTFREWIEVEMDLRMEGAAATELAENCEEEEGFHVPVVDWDHSSRRVLTLERIHGVRIDDLEGLKEAGHSPDAILEISSRIFFLQIFRDGYFHADMHPGNIFVDPDGRLCPVDFGIMGRVTREQRLFLADTLIGLLQGDYDRVAKAHFDIGYVPPTKSVEHFKQAMRAISTPLMDKPLEDISVARLLEQLFQTTERFDMQTQPDLLLLQKTLLVAEGVGRKLNPNANMWFMARPLIEEWVIANRGPEAHIAEAVGDTLDTLKSLPGAIRNAEKALQTLAEQKSRPPTPVTVEFKGWGPVLAAMILVLGAFILID